MFKFEDTNGNMYKVAFFYEKEEVQANPNNPRSQAHSRPKRSICTIMEAESGKEVATASVVVHPKAHFDYKSGRKWALRRAFEKTSFSRQDRTAAWKVLLNN